MRFRMGALSVDAGAVHGAILDGLLGLEFLRLPLLTRSSAPAAAATCR